MPTAYQLWGVHQADEDPRQIRFIVTEGGLGLFSIGDDDDFIDQLLQDLGIEAVVCDWSIIPYRSFYHSEYIDAGEAWQDRWYIIWKAHISLDPVPEGILITKPYLGTNATGQNQRTWPAEQERIGCLVVADFPDEFSCQAAKGEISSDLACCKFQARYGVCGSQVEVYKVYNERGKEATQMLLDLGAFEARFFAQGADYAWHVMRICTAHGGETHFSHLMLM